MLDRVPSEMQQIPRRHQPAAAATRHFAGPPQRLQPNRHHRRDSAWFGVALLPAETERFDAVHGMEVVPIHVPEGACPDMPQPPIQLDYQAEIVGHVDPIVTASCLAATRWQAMGTLHIT